MSEDTDDTVEYAMDNEPAEEPPVPAPSPGASHDDTPVPPTRRRRHRRRRTNAAMARWPPSGPPDRGPRGPPPPPPSAGFRGGDQRFEKIYLKVLLIYFYFTDTKSSTYIVKTLQYNLA